MLFYLRMRTNPNLENGHFPGQIPTRKWPFSTPKNPRLGKWSFSGWGFKSSIFASKKIPPGKRPFSTLKNPMHGKRPFSGWNFIFKKFFTGLENGQSHPRNSKFHVFDLESLKKSQGWKKSPPENGHFPCMGFKDFFLCLAES